MDETLLEKIRELTGLEADHPAYATTLYACARGFQLPVADAVKVVLTEIRQVGGAVHYTFLYDAVEHAGNGIARSVYLPPKQHMDTAFQELKKLGKEPKGNLAHLIWVEAMMRSPKTISEFMRCVATIRTSLKSPLESAITTTTLEEFFAGGQASG